MGSRILFSLFLLSLAALTACNDPDVSVGTLGKKLSAPVISGTSPFDQNFDTNNYVHITGTCDNRVGDLSISFVLSDTSGAATTSAATAATIAAAAAWHTPPSSPNVSNTTLSTTLINDTNCADGSFDFYLTKSDINSLWGFDPNSTSISVEEIQMKGATAIGDTKVLTLIDPHSGSNIVASKITIEKQWPRGFAGSDRCESFNVYLTDSNGNYATSSTAVSFSVSEAIGNGTASNLFAYSTWDDCNNYMTIAGVQTFSIPAGSNSAQIIVRMPADSADFNQTFSLKAASSGLTSAAAETFILRDGSSTSLHWVARDPNMAIRPHKDICYALNFNRYLYTGSLDSSAGGGVTFSLNPGNTNLKFYSDSSCASNISSLTFGTSSATANAYVKYNSTGNESGDSLRINVTMTSTATGYDFAPFYIDVDTSSSATVTQLQLMGPNEVIRDQCTAYMVSRDNSHYSPIPDTSALSITMSSTVSGASFYTDSSCASTAQTNFTINAGEESVILYFKTSDSNATAGTYNMVAAATGLTSANQSFTLKLLGNHVSFNPTASVTVGTCVPVRVYPMDNVGLVPASGNIGFSYTITSTAQGAFYTDASCSNQIATGTTATLSPYDSNAYMIYTMTTDNSAATYFTFQATVTLGNSTSTNSYNMTIQR